MAIYAKTKLFERNDFIMKKLFIKAKTRLQREEGMEMLQVVLIGGLVLVLIVTIFYPQMEKFFTSMISTITTWFEGKGSEPFSFISVLGG